MESLAVGTPEMRKPEAIINSSLKDVQLCHRHRLRLHQNQKTSALPKARNPAWRFSYAVLLRASYHPSNSLSHSTQRQLIHYQPIHALTCKLWCYGQPVAHPIRNKFWRNWPQDRHLIVRELGFDWCIFGRGWQQVEFRWFGRLGTIEFLNDGLSLCTHLGTFG